ncbi:MAG: 2-C-methyl-D-erythritol 4-phosphate cytidylyltransferase [Bacteroidales bacterium]|nr:2-C-methyl-D-erythritol 4-phosphate cytidylyltransferase [Bacteroidales bacterium]
MAKQHYLIVTAAGHGSRMGSKVPKQFLLLDGKAILQRTIERFMEADPSLRVITVLPSESIVSWKEYCQEKNFSCPQTLVKGGITRFHSVRNALSRVPSGVIVAVHDGVRPLLSAGMISSMFEAAENTDALVPVVPSVDTLKAVRKVTGEDGVNRLQGIPDRKIDRSEVFGAQTPQMFLSDVLKKAYNQPYDTSFTDDASVVEADGVPVDYFPGERFNIKITTPEDLYIAEAVMKMQEDLRRESHR